MYRLHVHCSVRALFVIAGRMAGISLLCKFHVAIHHLPHSTVESTRRQKPTYWKFETDFKKSRGSHTHSHDMDQRCLHPKSYMALQLRLPSSQAKCRTRIFLPLPATSSSRLPADLLSCTSMFIVQLRSQASLASRSNGMESLRNGN